MSGVSFKGVSNWVKTTFASVIGVTATLGGVSEGGVSADADQGGLGALLLESGSALLQESGGLILVE